MRAILFFTLLLSTLGAYSQTQPSLPSGTVPYSTNLYRATDGSIWTGKSGSYTNLGNKQYVDSLYNLGYTNEMIDSIALYNYDRARNRINHTGTQAQSTVVNLVSDLASKENISNKSTTLASPNDTNFPTTKAVSDGLNTKQDVLISGTNIKTINSESLLGSGDISINADTPTLQEVTTEGNETSKPILITGDENVPALYSGVEVSSVGVIKYDGGNRISAVVLNDTDGSWSMFKDDSGASRGIFYKNDEGIGGTPYDHMEANVPFKGISAIEVDEFVTLGQLNDSLDNHSSGLQQVTDSGNTTDKGVRMIGGIPLTSHTQEEGTYLTWNDDDGINGAYGGVRVFSDDISLNEMGGINVRETFTYVHSRYQDVSSYLSLSHELTSPYSPYAVFNGRVQGEDAINSNEFVTKGQLDSVNRGINTELISGSTININPDYQLNSCILSENTTITKPTGTIPDGVKVTLRIEASGASRNITWDSGFRPIGITLPTAIPDAKYMYAEMYYLSSTDTWMVTYIAMEI